MLGRIHSFESFGAVDGPGIRFIVFFQGCPLRCQFCHNPDTWHADGGREIEAAELVKNIAAYRNFIKNGGVTLSGGEPLMQPEFAREVLTLCKKEGFHTAIDTAGSLPLDKVRGAVEAADMLLLDIKTLDPDLCRELTGRDNRNALDLLNFCEKIGKTVWIRHVLVPGITLVETRLRELADFLQGYSCVKKVELLPFHQLGRYKWEALNEKYPLADTPEPSSEEIKEADKIFSALF